MARRRSTYPHAEGGVVQRQLRERLAAQQLMRSERANQRVAFECQAAVQIRVGARGARQPLQIRGPRICARAVKWLQSYRDERMQAHGRPVPIKPEQRRRLLSESGTPLTKSALDSAWQRLVRRAIAEDVVEKDRRFALHGLKHRGIKDSEDKAAGGHVTEAMRQLYDHSVPVVKAAVKPKKAANFPGNFPGRRKKASAPRWPFPLKPLFLRRFGASRVVPLIRIERMTYCLQDSCSTN